MFGGGSGNKPEWLEDEIAKDLGKTWQIDGIRVKPHGAMGGLHGTIEAVEELQKSHPDLCKADKLDTIKSIKIELSQNAFSHGGWEPARPITSTGAQMSAAYVCAVQFVDGEVLMHQFAADMLQRPEIWKIVDKTKCVLQNDFSDGGVGWTTRVTFNWEDGREEVVTRDFPRCVNPGTSDDEIVEKYRHLLKDVIDDNRREKLEKAVLGIDKEQDVREWAPLFAAVVKNPIA